MTGAAGNPEGTPANSGQGGVGGGGIPTNLFTQDQVNHYQAQAKRGALGSFFKELGFDEVPDAETIKNTFDAAGKFKEQQDGQKGDVERLNGELASEREKAAEVPTLKVQLLRQEIAGTENLPVRFWKFVEGKTDDEIKESINGLKKDLNLEAGEGGSGAAGEGGQGGSGQQQQAGTGARPPAPNPQQGQNNGGGTPSKTLAAGADAYAKKHAKKE